MIDGYCSEKYLPLKKIFQSYFINNEEAGAGFSIYQDGKPLIDIYGGYKNNKKEKWEKNTTVNIFSAIKGIYEILLCKLYNEKLIDIEKNVGHYWNSFKSSDKRNIKVKDVLSHRSGIYRFKTKININDLSDWQKIISILENQDPDHVPGEKTFYHAKTHGFLIGEVLKKIFKKSLSDLLLEKITCRYNLQLSTHLKKDDLRNTADIIYVKEPTFDNRDEFNAFNNPNHDLNLYNSEKFKTSEIPSFNGYSNSSSIAKIYDLVANVLKKNNSFMKKNTFINCISENSSQIDESLKMKIRWTKSGLILRGGYLFGKNKFSFGHNGWGGSVGFADPDLGIGVSYVTRKINPTMGSDLRPIRLIKEFYRLIEN